MNEQRSDSRFPLQVGKYWTLERPDGTVRAPCLVLDASGRIDGGGGNEARWALDGDDLVFKNPAGHVTARSSHVRPMDDGRDSMDLVAESDRKVVLHRLVERSDPPGDASQCRDGDELARFIGRHPSLRGQCRLGTSGFSFPEFRDMAVLVLTPERRSELEERGIRIVGAFGLNNVIVYDRSAKGLNLALGFSGQGYNTVILGFGANLRGSMNFEGGENLAVVGRTYPGRESIITATLRYHRSALVLGVGGSAGSTQIWIEGPERSVQIGDDYMFSWGIWLRTADSHAIVDLASRKVVNPSRSVVLESHVWLGQDVLVMPGTVIGAGSVVGARSVVSRSLPAACVAVGSPAKPVRRQASWTRAHAPSSAEIDHLVAVMGTPGSE